SMNLSGLSSDVRSRFLMYLARALNKLGKNSETLKVCRRVLKEPENPHTPHAIYLMAKTYWNWGESGKAMKALDKLFKRFSWHGVSAKGYYMAGRIKESEKDYAGAVNSWEKAVSSFPEAEEAQACLWHIGWRYYQDGDYAKAEKAFNRFLKKYPASHILPRILYWNARAMEKRGNDPSELIKRLMTVYRYSYYAYLRTNEIFHKTEKVGGNPGSQKRLAEKVLARLNESANETVKQPKLEGRRLWAHRGAQRWLELGFKERAKPLIRDAAGDLKNGTSNTMWLMYQYYRAGFHDLVQSRAWRVQSDPKLTENERRLLTWMMFPLARWSVVYGESRKNGVDPMAVLALIRQESKFNADIVSSADARGLMQIIPPTGKRISRAMNEKNFNPDFLFDPEVNIRMGTFYLAALLRKSGGELAPALASYNAGSRAVDKWLKKYSYSAAEAEVFIERIPYPETRGYVKKVLRNYGAYRKTYGQYLNGPEAGGAGKKANAGRSN
ncbi:MAG: transglycosylase SLT domain-containing protein, partial [Nitrospinota bacterium]